MTPYSFDVSYFTNVINPHSQPVQCLKTLKYPFRQSSEPIESDITSGIGGRAATRAETESSVNFSTG